MKQQKLLDFTFVDLNKQDLKEKWMMDFGIHFLQYAIIGRIIDNYHFAIQFILFYETAKIARFHLCSPQ